VWLGYLVPGRYKYGDLDLQVGGVKNLKLYNEVKRHAGHGHENNCADEAQQQL
jgi:hypothetical protein